MKVTKVILALMAVAMMVIVPLSVADVDAEKEITEAYAGSTVRNDKDLSYSDYTAVEDGKLSSYTRDYVYSYAFEYCNVKPANMTVTSMKLTTYDYNAFSEQKGKEFTVQYGYTLKGSITFTYNVEKDGSYPLYTSNTSETDLLNVANKELGTAKITDVITVTGDFEVIYVLKQYQNFKEAKETYVLETFDYEEYVKGYSDVKVTLNNKSVSINMEYADDFKYKDKENLDNITSETETSDIPYSVQCTRTASYDVYKASLKGTVADKEYTSDLDKKLNETLKSRADTNTKSFTDSTVTYDHLICKSLTIEYIYYYTSDVTTFLKDHGCTGETNASGASNGINSQVNSTKGNSGDSGFSIWIIVAIVIAVIVIAVIVVLLIKKKQ